MSYKAIVFTVLLALLVYICLSSRIDEIKQSQTEVLVNQQKLINVCYVLLKKVKEKGD